MRRKIEIWVLRNIAFYYDYHPHFYSFLAAYGCKWGGVIFWV